MKIYKEESLRYFDFWSGAKDTAKALTDEQFCIIENTLEELYPDGMSETDINDLFWFEQDWIAEMLGYEDFEELEEDNK